MNSITLTPNGQNRTPEIVRILTHAPKDTVLRFSPGTYDFYREGAYRGMFFPTCNRSGDKDVIFPFLRLQDITIDGGGADFVFHDRVSPFIAQASRNIRFMNFTVDFSFPRCCACRVLSSAQAGLLLDMSASGCNVGVNTAGNMTIQAGSDLFSSCERRFFLKQGMNVCFIAAGEIFFDTQDRPAPYFFCDAEKTEEGIFLRARNGGFFPQFEEGELMISYDELRENDVFFVDSCEDTSFENVRIYHGAGMGCAGQLNHNMTFDRFDIAPPDGSGDRYSTTADGILLSQCTGRIDIRNCTIRYPLDDVMSIHGFYTVVEKITAPNKAVLRLMHRSHAGFNPYVPGDLLSVSDGRTMNETGMVTIKDARFMDDMYRLYAEFTEDIRTRLHPGDYLENPSRTPEVSVTDCNFSDFPAIRFGTARSVYFARNHVKSFHSLLLNDLAKYWYASGHVNRVNIEENVFENSENAIRTLLERPAGCNVFHRFVKIVKNRFVNCPCLLNAADVNYLTFQDNVYDDGCVKLTRVMNADIQEIAGAENASHGLLLMHWKTREVSVGNCPIGYTLHQWRRGGDAVLSKEEFEKGWLRCVFRANPCGSSDFSWLYEDKRIPNDGFFAILDEHGNMAATASVQMDEYCPNSATLHMVYTNLNHRGKGLEEIVSRAAMRYVYDAGVPEAYLATDDIHSGTHIFLKNGFNPVLYTAEMPERWRRVLTDLGIAEVTAMDIHGETCILSGKC